MSPSANVSPSNVSGADNAPLTNPQDNMATVMPSSPSLLSSSFPSIVAVRDRRAYEHERQRAQKSAEHFLTKARKEGWLPRLSAQPIKRGTPAGELRLTDDDLIHVETGPGPRFEAYRGAFGKSETPRKEVGLAELITTAKPRKSKGITE